jgi:hypothetical protein
MVMTPYTVHLVAQFIRHNRAMATSVEKWIASPGFCREDAREAVGYFRKVLDAYERSLNGVVTTEQSGATSAHSRPSGSGSPVLRREQREYVPPFSKQE